MAAPVDGDWDTTILSDNNLNKTTYGQGTSFPSTWKVDRVFWRTDENRMYKNSGTEVSPVWDSMGGSESHEFTSAETFTPSKQTGITQITIDASNIVKGKMSIVKDGSTVVTAFAGDSKTKIVNPVTSLSLKTDEEGYEISNHTYIGHTSLDFGLEIRQDFEFSFDGLKCFILPYNPPNNEYKILEFVLTTAYDLTTATANAESYDFSSQMGNYFAKTLQFKSDGTKVFISSEASQSKSPMWQATLSTAWDITTMGTLQIQNTQGYYSKPAFISHDGMRVYRPYINSSNGQWKYWDLTTAYDITSNTTTNSAGNGYVSFSAGLSAMGNSASIRQGSNTYFLCDSSNEVEEFTISGTTATHVRTITLPTAEVGDWWRGIHISPNGMKAVSWQSHSNASRFQVYNLPSASNFNSRSIDTGNVMAGQTGHGNPHWAVMSPDGNRLFTGQGGDGRIIQRTLTTSYDLATADDSTMEFLTSTGDPFDYHGSFSPDGKYLNIIKQSTPYGDIETFLMSTPYDITTAISMGVQTLSPATGASFYRVYTIHSSNTNFYIISNEYNASGTNVAYARKFARNSNGTLGSEIQFLELTGVSLNTYNFHIMPNPSDTLQIVKQDAPSNALETYSNFMAQYPTPDSTPANGNLYNTTDGIHFVNGWGGSGHYYVGDTSWSGSGYTTVS